MNRRQKIDAILNQVTNRKRGSIPIAMWLKEPKKVFSMLKLKTNEPD